jgi:hypothetical protein
MRMLLTLVPALLMAGCHYHYVRRDPVTTTQIIQMSRQGVPATEIIQKIEVSGTVYIMDSKDVVDLKEQGVDHKVIDHMMKTRERALEREAYYHRYYYPYYYGAYPYAGFGYHYCW